MSGLSASASPELRYLRLRFLLKRMFDVTRRPDQALLRKLLKEPLVHFLALGVLLFGVLPARASHVMLRSREGR